MINVSIVTRPDFKGSTSNLRYDCKRIVVTALTLDPVTGQHISASIHTAMDGQIGSVDALVIVSASDMSMYEEDRLNIGDMIQQAIIDVHPGLRVSVLLSFDPSVGDAYTLVTWLGKLGQTTLTERVAKIVAVLQGLRGLVAS